MPAYYTVNLDPFQPPGQPSIETLAALTPCEWNPVRNICAAQDTLVGGARRVLGEWGLRGSDDWPWDESGPINNFPPLVEWRNVQPPLPSRLTPGNYLRLRVLFAPTGNTEDGISEALAHPEGWVRVRCTWGNGATLVGPIDYEIELPAQAADGVLPTAEGSIFSLVDEKILGEIFPPDVDDIAATSATYSEGTDVTTEIYVRGGVRVIDAILEEYPLRHTQAHNELEPRSVHGASAGGVPLVAMTPVPQTDRRDGLTYQDRRFGSHQLLRTAARQSECLGPKILTWTPWASDGASFNPLNSQGDDIVEPVRVTGTISPVELVDGSTAGYDPDRSGWLVAASHAQLHKFCGDSIMVGQGRAVVPVRVTVHARWSGAGARVPRVRVQSSDTEWVDVPFTSFLVIESRSAIGWLETQVQADQATAVLQAFGILDDPSDILDVYGISIDWGWKADPGVEVLWIEGGSSLEQPDLINGVDLAATAGALDFDGGDI